MLYSLHARALVLQPRATDAYANAAIHRSTIRASGVHMRRAQHCSPVDSEAYLTSGLILSDRDERSRPVVHRLALFVRAASLHPAHVEAYNALQSEMGLRQHSVAEHQARSKQIGRELLQHAQVHAVYISTSLPCHV